MNLLSKTLFPLAAVFLLVVILPERFLFVLAAEHKGAGWALLLGLLCLAALGFLSFKFKKNFLFWIFPLGLLLAVAGNLVWFGRFDQINRQRGYGLQVKTDNSFEYLVDTDPSKVAIKKYKTYLSLTPYLRGKTVVLCKGETGLSPVFLAKVSRATRCEHRDCSGAINPERIRLLHGKKHSVIKATGRKPFTYLVFPLGDQKRESLVYIWPGQERRVFLIPAGYLGTE